MKKTRTKKYSDEEYEDEEDDDEPLLDEENTSTNATGRQVAPVFRRETSVKPKSVFESLDYEICENALWEKEQKNLREPIYLAWKDFTRWMVFLLIGIITALVACCIDIVIEELSAFKYSFLKKSVDKNVINGDLLIPYFYWLVWNVIPVVIGATLVTYIEPVAAGSGIPQVKCYLNGVKVPRIVRIKTLGVKAVGVATSVIGGLAGGKEGPMIHCGAVIAAGISQGKSTTYKKDFKILRYFRDDHEKRDFVVGGAAAGVSAAFGSPIGGLLFSLEEAASFWNQSLIWKTLFASVISSFTLNLVLSAYHGMENFTYPGLFNLGEFLPLPFEYYELPMFVVMGVFGGLSGALWNAINTCFINVRRYYIRPRWGKVLEAVVIAMLSATVACILMYSINDCRPLGQDPTKYPIQLFCQDNEYNAVAALWFQTPEESVKSLFHDPPGSHRILTLALFVVIYFFLSCITFGMSVSLGIFIPLLLVGAAWGRLTAMTLSLIFPSAVFTHPGKYALIGAAAQLGGCVRMTISLSVILIETTGNITFALPLIITLISAKFTGDYFNEGIYDTITILANVPMLPWTLPHVYNDLKASNIMSTPVVCIKLREKARYIADMLRNCDHNGFPVVDDLIEDDRSKGRVRGLILRSQLIIILKNSFYEEKEKFWKNEANIDSFRNEYPRYPSIDKIKLHEDKNDYTINSEMFMNPSPKKVLEVDSVPRTFQLFRALGLRHLLVVDVENRCQGIITRKDFIQH